MIVWIASYPRSGNTFTRIVLNRIYGTPTYTEAAAADDLSYDVGAGDLTGHRLLSEDFPEWKDRSKQAELMARLEEDERVFFIKTHGGARFKKHNKHRALIIVRDAKDVFISFANYLMDVLWTWPRFFREARGLRARKWKKWAIKRTLSIGLATFLARGARAIGARKWWIRKNLKNLVNDPAWTAFHQGWLDRADGRHAVIRFEELIKDPIGSMDKAMQALEIPLNRGSGAIPTFEELKKVHPQFFRKGKVGNWKKEFPPVLDAAFQEKHGPMMQRLGYLQKQET